MRRAPRPPWLAMQLLEIALPVESRESVIGDLVEQFESDAVARPVVAWTRFWREALAAIVELQLTPDSVTAFTPYTRETPMQSFIGDLRHALRVLTRARGFTVVCVLTLGVAVGATTALFSLVNPVLLRPLALPSAERLVMVWERERDGSPSRMGYATYVDLRREVTSLASAAMIAEWQPTLFGDQDAERVNGESVSWEYFRTLGVRPAIGRDFEAADDTPDGVTPVILSHGLWVRRFGADPSIVGKRINVSGTPRDVIGVMPASFSNPDPTRQIWRGLGYATQPWACRTCRHLVMIGRLRPDVSRAQAEREVDGAMARITAANPKEYASTGGVVTGMQEMLTRTVRPILLALFGAVGLVLLIAAANVTNLQLARAIRRDGEFAVRAALGAGRRRLAQQLFAEGLVLAVLGGAVGVLLAHVALPVLVAQLPDSLPGAARARVDASALGVVALITLTLAVVMGLAPVVRRGAGAGMFATLRSGGRTLGGASHRARMMLVISEVALALMLLVGAALLGRSLLRLTAVDPGFDAGHVLTLQVQASGSAYATGAAVFANHDRVREAVRQVPGVMAVGLASQLALAGNIDRFGVAARDKPLDNPELAPAADRYAVTADFMSTMKIPVLRGRGFTEAEANDSSVKVAIVSQALARRIWPGEDAIGKYIRLGGPQRPWWQVIGIAGDVRHSGLDATVTQQVYVPERQWFWPENVMTLVVRTQGDPAAMASRVREAVRSVDPLQPIVGLATMESLITQSTAQRRLGLMLFGGFGLMALLLAAAGIYGVLASAVIERTREFGVRSALGATPGSILGLVMREGATLAAVGLVIGGALALGLSRYLRALLFGVEATDASSMLAAVCVIGVMSLASALVPALRATRVDPMTALRSD